MVVLTLVQTLMDHSGVPVAQGTTWIMMKELVKVCVGYLHVDYWVVKLFYLCLDLLIQRLTSV